MPMARVALRLLHARFPVLQRVQQNVRGTDPKAASALIPLIYRNFSEAKAVAGHGRACCTVQQLKCNNSAGRGHAFGRVTCNGGAGSGRVLRSSSVVLRVTAVSPSIYNATTRQSLACDRPKAKCRADCAISGAPSSVVMAQPCRWPPGGRAAGRRVAAPPGRSPVAGL